jgi:crescentin
VIAGGKAAGDAAMPSADEMATRVGKEHEALRTMLADAARRIGGLDLVKEAYEKLSEPIVKTMQALEHEKVHNAALQTLLAGVSAAHDKNRSELQASKQRTVALESANEKLRSDLERALEVARTIDAARLKLVSELAAKRDQIGNLERQLAHESTERKRFAEERSTLGQQLSEAEKRIVQLETEAAIGREKGVLSEAELRSLRKSLDETVAEAARLSRRLTDSDNNLAAAHTQIAKVGTAISAATAERDRLANALDDANGRHQGETHSLNVRLEAMQSRAQAAEKLLAEVRQSLAARTEEARDFDRKNVETTLALNAAGKKIQELEAAMAALEGSLHDREQANETLTERNNGLTRNLRERESALSRAEEYVQAMTDRIAKLEADMEASQAAYEKRIEEINVVLQRERMERSMAEGALESARRDYALLHRDYTTLHAGLESGAKVAAG